MTMKILDALLNTIGYRLPGAPQPISPTTYYIVEFVDDQGDKGWRAHPESNETRRGKFDIVGSLAYSSLGPDRCEQKLRTLLASRCIEPRVIRVVKI